jgi:hypothetical protein
MRWAEATTGSGSIGAGEGEADGEKKRRREREREEQKQNYIHTDHTVHTAYRTYRMPYALPTEKNENTSSSVFDSFFLSFSLPRFSPSSFFLLSSPLLSSPLLSFSLHRISLFSLLSPLSLFLLPPSPHLPLRPCIPPCPAACPRIGSGQGPFADMSWDHPVHRYVYSAVPCPLYVLSGMP